MRKILISDREQVDNRKLLVCALRMWINEKRTGKFINVEHTPEKKTCKYMDTKICFLFGEKWRNIYIVVIRDHVLHGLFGNAYSTLTKLYQRVFHQR